LHLSCRHAALFFCVCTSACAQTGPPGHHLPWPHRVLGLGRHVSLILCWHACAHNCVAPHTVPCVHSHTAPHIIRNASNSLLPIRNLVPAEAAPKQQDVTADPNREAILKGGLCHTCCCTISCMVMRLVTNTVGAPMQDSATRLIVCF